MITLQLTDNELYLIRRSRIQDLIACLSTLAQESSSEVAKNSLKEVELKVVALRTSIYLNENRSLVGALSLTNEKM